MNSNEQRQLISPKLINSSYDKDQVYRDTEEERELYETMRTPVNDHLINELINKTLTIDKYRQVMQTFGINWFEAEKEVDRYKVISKSQQDEINILKSYVGLDKKDEQERKIREMKRRQEQELKEIAVSDKSFEEKVNYLTRKLTERDSVKKLTDSYGM